MNGFLARWRRTSRRPSGVLYQYYATIHPETCGVCLDHHGRILERPEGEETPPLHPGCRCSLLEFSAGELEYYREQERRMRGRAQEELRRRRLFREGEEALARGDFEGALARFRESVQIDVFTSDVEHLCRGESPRGALESAPEVAQQLRDLFVRAYRWKHDLPKYRHMPERMRLERRDHGLRVIRELFAPFVDGPAGGSGDVPPM